MNKIPVSSLTDSQILSKLIYYEEGDTLNLGSTEDGGVSISDLSTHTVFGEGQTFREALIALAKSYIKDGWDRSEVDWDK